MATKAENVDDLTSCLNRAESDEPIFVLRAHDVLAPGIVRQWARLRYYARGPRDTAADDAEDIADAMEKWRKIHG